MQKPQAVGEHQVGKCDADAGQSLPEPCSHAQLRCADPTVPQSVSGPGFVKWLKLS